MEGRPLCYSVGFYRGRHRVTLAWFADFGAAKGYLSRIRASYPHLKADLLKSMF